MISIIIVTYNSAAVIGECIQSIPQGCEIIVVDNDSKDESATIASNLGAKVLRNESNVGFGTACNYGAASASGEFLFFLNPDARLKPDTVEKLLIAHEKYTSAGILAPRITDDGGNVFLRHRSVLYWTAPWRRKYKPNADAVIKYTQGSAMFFPRIVFDKVRGFDEKIFLFFEDDDICFRVRKAGYEIRYIHHSVVHHLQGVSTQPSFELRLFREYHSWKSRKYVCLKHGRPLYGWYHIAKNWLRLCFSRLTGNKYRIGISEARLKALTEH